jgi:hypothetical protein
MNTMNADPHPALGFARIFRAELQVVDPTIKLPTEAPHEDPATITAAVDQHPAPLSALCLSGGGIRSAVFGLGVLQGLKRFGLLEQFHYLSTVSGGGYIGGWLSAWRSVQPDSMVLTGLSALQDTGLDAPEIHGIRADSNYITPRLGLLSADTWTVLTLYLRNLVLNWLIFVPFFVGCLLIPVGCVSILEWVISLGLLVPGGPERNRAIHIVAVTAGSLLLCLGLSISVYGRFRMQGKWLSQSRFVLGVLVPLVASAACFCTASQAFFTSFLTEHAHLIGPSFGCILYFLAWFIGRIIARPSREPVEYGELLAWVLAGGLVGLLVVHWISVVLPNMNVSLVVVVGLSGCVAAYLTGEIFYIGAASFARRGEMDREWLARASGWLSAAAVIWLVVSGLALFGPPTLVRLRTYLGGTTLIGLGGASGLLTLILGGNSSTAGTIAGRVLKSLSWQRIASIAAVIFAVTLGILLCLIGQHLPGMAQSDQLSLPGRAPPLHAAEWMLGLVALAFVVSYFVNVNRFSLHALYRNRLSRAFIGSARASVRKPDPFTGFDPNDNVALSNVTPLKSPNRLFHVINAALNIVATKNPAWQERKAESFTFSRQHCGSPIVGFRPTNEFAGEREGGLTLATAMAVSGAAVSPNQGYNSSPLIGFLLMLFNVRLGWWFGNPGKASYAREGPLLGITPALRELCGDTTDDSRWVYLSDGGHFENLGLYEMIRRRCRIILISDADCDPDFDFQDLGNAARKVFIDFGVSLEFRELELQPRLKSPLSPGQPALPATARFAIGRIVYPGSPHAGWLLYIKPTYQANEGVGIRSYASQHATFPHESTADQWFGESQLESYRALGAYLMELLCTGGKAPDAESRPAALTLDQLHEIADHYLHDPVRAPS